MAEPGIGLLGYNCLTGLGELNRTLCKQLGIKDWLVIDRRGKKTLAMPEGVSDTKHSGMLDKGETLLFAESPFEQQHVLAMAKNTGKRVVCVPMWEWLAERETPWLGNVDLFICPTRCCFEKFKDELPCVYLPWPIDCERFKFERRKTCKRFLFINGNGGWRGRKGLAVIEDVLRLWPDMPLTVRTQLPLDSVKQRKFEKYPNLKLIQGEQPDNTDLYRLEDGDVLLCPHSMDGIGLECLEAQACGLPVVLTLGEPWNEYNALRRIDSAVLEIKTRRTVDWYQPCSVDLHRICRELLGANLEVVSLLDRGWAEERSWSKLREKWLEAVVSGKGSTHAGASRR